MCGIVLIAGDGSEEQVHILFFRSALSLQCWLLLCVEQIPHCTGRWTRRAPIFGGVPGRFGAPWSRCMRESPGGNYSHDQQQSLTLGYYEGRAATVGMLAHPGVPGAPANAALCIFPAPAAGTASRGCAPFGLQRKHPPLQRQASSPCHPEHAPCMMPRLTRICLD